MIIRCVGISAYILQFPPANNGALRSIIWKPWAPGKMKLFSWLLHLNRLWCNDRLQRHSWENGYFCQLCLRNLESSYHLFWECPLSLQVWTQASTWKGCGALNTRNWEAAGCTTTRVQDLIRRAAPGQERKAIKSIIILITWEIRQERSGCTFRGKMACTADILGRIRANLDLWRLAGAKSLEHPFRDQIGR